jgi:hypothetical protein
MSNSDDESLTDYLDRLVYSQYVITQRGIGYISKSPLQSAIIDYIEDEETGRKITPEDSSDHFLLRHFDDARRNFADAPLIIPRRYGGEFPPQQDVHGEIPWRKLHTDE